MESEKLDEKIDQLASQFESPSSDRRDWKALWSTIKELSSDFKGVRYPTRDERNAAWSRFQSIVQNIKQAQAKEFEQRNARVEQSTAHLSQIQSLASSAGTDDAFVELILHVATGGMTLIAKLALDALLGKSDEEFQRLQGRSEIMKRAWAYLSDHKTEMTGRDKATAYALLEKTKERLDNDWGRWKTHRQEIVAERNREREAKRQEWRVGQRQFIERLEGAEYKLEAAISRRQEHLSKLIGQYESAWSDGYRERVQGWIEEERSNIADIESKLEDVRAKLSEARLRLDS
jgi:hypothetical protein